MHEFSLEDPIEDLDEGDLRSTLDEFMEKHAENVDEYEALVSERDEFSEKLEGMEEQVSEYAETEDALQAKFSEIVAEETPLFDADEVAERFSLDELIEKADTLGAFSLSTEETVEGDGGEAEEAEEPTFAEKPEKAPNVSGEQKGAFREQAESDLRAVLGDY
jgi:DNA repair ATPase RecN